MGPGALAGVGQGVGQLGQMAMQGALAQKQLQHQDKWIEASLFRRAAPSIMNQSMGDYQTYLDRKADADNTMNAIQRNPLSPTNPQMTQVSRMLPDEESQIPASAALLAKRF